MSNIMLYTPNFDQSRLPFWTLAADYRGALPEAVLASLQRLQGVRYVVITSEEMLDFTEEQLTSESFPWDDPRLVMAALLHNERWDVRSGPMAPT